MRHRISGRKLRRPTSHRLAMLRNLVVSLILHESIKVSVAKAKEVRPLAEKAISWGKDGGQHAHRLAFSTLRNKAAATKLFEDLGKRYSSRHGGYTRILRIGTRLGDRSDLALLELVDKVKVDKPSESRPKDSEKSKNKTP